MLLLPALVYQHDGYFLAWDYEAQLICVCQSFEEMTLALQKLHYRAVPPNSWLAEEIRYKLFKRKGIKV